MASVGSVIVHRCTMDVLYASVQYLSCQTGHIGFNTFVRRSSHGLYNAATPDSMFIQRLLCPFPLTVCEVQSCSFKTGNVS